MMHFITKAMRIDTINVKHDVKRLKTVELYKLVIKASFHVNVYLRIAFWANIHTSQTKEIFKMQLVHASNAKVLHISCNMGTRDLPDVYALSPPGL